MQFVLWLIYSFGYDEVHDDYKVVGVFYTYEQAEVSEKRLNGPDKFVNGKFHWAIIARGHNVYKGRNIYSFDLTDKKWEKTVAQPSYRGGDLVLWLAVLEKSIRYSEVTNFDGDYEVEIYVESPVSPFPTEERKETSHQDNRATKNSDLVPLNTVKIKSTGNMELVAGECTNNYEVLPKDPSIIFGGKRKSSRHINGLLRCGKLDEVKVTSHGSLYRKQSYHQSLKCVMPQTIREAFVSWSHRRVDKAIRNTWRMIPYQHVFFAAYGK
ncbi:hypothetical protein P3S67_001717 [Capsicum chacoense]